MLFYFFLLKIFNDWKYISLVLDRIQLFLFLIVTFIGSLSMLLQVPKLFEPHRDALLTGQSATPHP
jgi:hypothetical protein